MAFICGGSGIEKTPLMFFGPSGRFGWNKVADRWIVFTAATIARGILMLNKITMEVQLVAAAAVTEETREDTVEVVDMANNNKAATIMLLKTVRIP